MVWMVPGRLRAYMLNCKHKAEWREMAQCPPLETFFLQRDCITQKCSNSASQQGANALMPVTIGDISNSNHYKV